MPDDRYDFDKLRSPLLRREHLARGKQHKHPVSRKIASFLLGVEDILQNSDAMVFVTAVGGMPFANYIRGPGLPKLHTYLHVYLSCRIYSSRYGAGFACACPGLHG